MLRACDLPYGKSQALSNPAQGSASLAAGGGAAGSSRGNAAAQFVQRRVKHDRNDHADRQPGDGLLFVLSQFHRHRLLIHSIVAAGGG